MDHPVSLAAFEGGDAPVVASWIRSDDEADQWASVRLQAVTPQLFAAWHADHEVRPFVARDDGRACGYGEVWVDADEHDAELARIVVDPQRRGRGVGRRLAELLAAEAMRLGFADVWLRVVPTNTAAIACYTAAGFVRASAEVEQAFNQPQPRPYVWMRFEGAA
ncbi:MAG: GNAT family N-acetyltransferase [Actinomycetota bacterium]|nr:GNAT family N-acetyltransferase [Actinomycetota bacterium]